MQAGKFTELTMTFVAAMVLFSASSAEADERLRPARVANSNPHVVAHPAAYAGNLLIGGDGVFQAGNGWCDFCNECPGHWDGHKKHKKSGCPGVSWLEWLVYDKYYKRSPDHGWARVTKRPIRRKGVEYIRYWPDRWYGQPRIGRAEPIRRYPMVAEPTDTTHLGYYYHHVPTWQPRPGMLPKPPRPSSWHVRECGAGMERGIDVWVPLDQIHWMTQPVIQPAAPAVPNAAKPVVPAPAPDLDAPKAKKAAAYGRDIRR